MAVLENSTSKKRLTSIEILRILAMFLIVMYHFSWYGDFNFSTSAVSINRLWIQFMQLVWQIWS